MPDVHAGKGCTIGTTMTIVDKVVPNMVGVDIGCGMYTVNLGRVDIDLQKFDEAAHTIPCGRNIWDEIVEPFDLTRLRCYENLRHPSRLAKSLGTLGGGNHFIEIDADEDGNKYLIIHSGSRNLGKQVAEYYQALAIDLNLGMIQIMQLQQELLFLYQKHAYQSHCFPKQYSSQTFRNL